MTLSVSETGSSASDVGVASGITVAVGAGVEVGCISGVAAGAGAVGTPSDVGSPDCPPLQEIARANREPAIIGTILFMEFACPEV